MDHRCIEHVDAGVVMCLFDEFCVPRQDSDGSHPEHESHSHSSVSSIPLSNLSTPMEMDALLDGRNWGWLARGLVERYTCKHQTIYNMQNTTKKYRWHMPNPSKNALGSIQFPTFFVRVGNCWSPGWATGRHRRRRRARRGTCGDGPRKRRPRRPDWWIAGETQTVKCPDFGSPLKDYSLTSHDSL